ncbi:hypothetical protein [Chromobacterium sp. IIBBL 290-4]|uniref:hypothetical protein n=1 Tax=Chromobacterium sp. IIBBL 290-4 TaxID=2953890 RepID=UPI0020B7DF18|nr:hypothetical protein [Chromobacterium sp. IIBBL 290-4]UTH73718.1 hypothetical protein NKT35_19570 [Chromobacterium sp. IIBBL 290-4]
MPKLAGALGLSRLVVDEAIRDLYRSGLLQYQADRRELPVSGYLTVMLDSVTTDPQEAAWRQALAGAGLCEEVAEELSGLSSSLGGMTPEDLAALARVLRRLSEADPASFDDAGFNVSARHLLGSSKVLSMMTGRMMDALGLPLRLQNSSPRYVICAGPPDPVATLLIENPRAFENAVCSGLSEEVALICTYGFGLSYLGQERLHTTGTSVNDQPIMIVRGGSPPQLKDLLRANQVFFWGDLDLAAINIYRALKRAVPQLQMSRIYEAMLPLLASSDHSHPYAEMFDKSGQVKSTVINTPGPHDLDSGCLFLWHTCQTRAVDQEAVSNLTIRLLGSFPLTMSESFRVHRGFVA